ncbi:MAG: hypothetical protein K9J30_09615 [Bacteroidales bacterium]|nr:hypothetical protein [Bacteroidales bacterium]
MTKKLDTKSNNEIIEISIKDPLYIKSAETNNNSFWEWIKRIGGIVGLFAGFLALIATLFIINDRLFLEPKINAKIISFNADEGEFEYKRGSISRKYFGARYFLKLSINITSKDLNFTDLEVVVKYPNNNKEYEGVIFSPRNYSEWKLDGVAHTLKLPQENLLYYKSTLEKNYTHLDYLTFIVFDKKEELKLKLEEMSDKKPEYIRLNFISSDKKFYRKTNNEYPSNNMSLSREEEKYIWENELWLKK